MYVFTCRKETAYMGLILRNDVTKLKMAAVVWDIHKFCMGNYGKKNFLSGDISAKKRYRAPTHKYGYSVTKRILI